MQVSEIMTADVTTAALDDSVGAVAQTMKDEDAGAGPVLLNSGELCGIITHRGIVIGCIAGGASPARSQKLPPLRAHGRGARRKAG